MGVKGRMHGCQKFREDWLGGSGGDLDGCDDCRQFCKEARVIIAALDVSRPAPPSEDYWPGFDDRLRARLKHQNDAQWLIPSDPLGG